MKRSKLIFALLMFAAVCFSQVGHTDTTLLSDYTFDGDTTVTVDMFESAKPLGNKTPYRWSLAIWWTGATGTLDATVQVLSSATQNDNFTLYSAAHSITLPYAAGDTIFTTGDETFNSNWLQLKLTVNNQTTSTFNAKLTRWKNR